MIGLVWAVVGGLVVLGFTAWSVAVDMGQARRDARMRCRRDHPSARWERRLY